jgi:UDP-3-O-[3-hydroxymyristoyl] glucosamine N-acyltransferase
MHKRTLTELARHVGGRVCGDGDTVIRAAATLEQARKGDITFLVNRKYERLVHTTQASAVIAGEELPDATVPVLVADDPYYAFTQILVLLYGHRRHTKTGISPRAAIAETAAIGKDCHVHEFASIADHAKVGDACVIYPGVHIAERVRIGDGCIIYPNVVIYERCRIGNRVIINANTTVGEDGFGYATHQGTHHKIPQVGIVIVEDDVEIGSGCGIERGTLSDTVVGQGSKLGDLVTIGHGTRIGAHSLLVAQVGIAGSATLGHHCVVGGQVGIVGHITIGNNVTIGAQAGVINDVPDGETVMGAPAIDAGQARRAYTVLQHLPQMRQDIRALQNRVKKIVASTKADDGHAKKS